MLSQSYVLDSTYVQTRPSLSAGLSAPKMSFDVADVNAGSPAIGKYSWSSVSSSAKIFFACVGAENAQHRRSLTRLKPEKLRIFCFVKPRLAVGELPATVFCRASLLRQQCFCGLVQASPHTLVRRPRMPHRTSIEASE